MKRIYVAAIIVSGLLYGCGSSVEDLEPFMVDLSEFTIDNDALEDFEYVEILGASDKITTDMEMDFYNLVVVRSIKTGDTVNILVTEYYPLQFNDNQTRFVSNGSELGKLMEYAGSDDKQEGVKIDEIKVKTFDKVFYDSEFIQIDVTKYPAITGTIGDYTVEGSFEDLNL